MVSENIQAKIISFLRKEYFDPDVLKALLVTAGLVVPLVVSHFLGVPAYGSFATITAQLFLAAKFKPPIPRKLSFWLLALFVSA